MKNQNNTQYSIAYLLFDAMVFSVKAPFMCLFNRIYNKINKITRWIHKDGVRFEKVIHKQIVMQSWLNDSN